MNQATESTGLNPSTIEEERKEANSITEKIKSLVANIPDEYKLPLRRILMNNEDLLEELDETTQVTQIGESSYFSIENKNHLFIITSFNEKKPKNLKEIVTDKKFSITINKENPAQYLFEYENEKIDIPIQKNSEGYELEIVKLLETINTVLESDKTPEFYMSTRFRDIRLGGKSIANSHNLITVRLHDEKNDPEEALLETDALKKMEEISRFLTAAKKLDINDTLNVDLTHSTDLLTGLVNSLGKTEEEELNVLHKIEKAYLEGLQKYNP